LQELLALLHRRECPLHELTPSHFTFASAAVAVVTTAVENITAAAAAEHARQLSRVHPRFSRTLGLCFFNPPGARDRFAPASLFAIRSRPEQDM